VFAQALHEVLGIEALGPECDGNDQEHAAGEGLPEFFLLVLVVLGDEFIEQGRAMRGGQFLIEALRVAVAVLEKVPAGDAEKNYGKAEGDTGNPSAHEVFLLGGEV
jgi:hypothetical protein